MSADPARSPAGRAGHVVQFYGSESELASSAGHYLAEGLGAGAVAIVIATARHRAAIRAHMAAHCDVAAARARGDLVVLDADEMLRLFLIGGRPDPGGHTVSQLVGPFPEFRAELPRTSTSSGRPARIAAVR